MNKTVELTASGLSIAPESLQDAADIHQYMGCDPEITRYTGWNPYRTLQDTVDKITRDLGSTDTCYSWVIRKNGEFIGTIGAYDYRPEDRSIEIGYSIARRSWGNGYAGTAVGAVIGFLRNEPGIKAIRAWSHAENAASLKILRRAGFTETGRDGENITFELRF